MQAAFQKYTDNAVSKTVNMANSATKEDITAAYLQAYETGCMGITVYRDGCKDIQVLTMGAKTNGHIKEPVVELQPRPIKVEGATYRIETPLGSAFITVNQDAGGNPFEVFVIIGRAGSEVAAMAEAIGRLISMNLRFGNHTSPKERAREIVEQLRGIGGGSAVGFGPNRVRSLPDAVAKAIAMHFSLNDELRIKNYADGKTGDKVQSKRRDLCPGCGAAAFVFEEGCSKCYACGYSKC